MKKSILSIIAFLLAAVGAKAQVVTVSDVEAVPGETISFSLNLTGGEADTYTALQFSIDLPDGITTTGFPTFSSSWPGATGSVGSTAAFASSEVMEGSNIENLVTISLKVDESVGVGTYNVTLSNIQFRYGTSGAHDDAADVTFKVNVVERHTVILDEMATTAPEGTNGKSVDVIVKRTIKANSWSTICLPFAMTEEQVTSAFGAGVIVKDFTGCETTESGSDITALKLNFSTVSAMEANHPYLIKVANAITYEDGFTVDGVDIAPEADPSVDCDEKSVKIGKITYDFYNSFVGTYVADTQVPNLCLFISNDKFYYSTGKTKIKAFRGYFDFYNVLSSVDTSSARISTNFDDEATGINTVHSSGFKAEGTYDLQGRKIENPKKGLYINNGKKVVVK
jgi:hypothetical protein